MALHRTGSVQSAFVCALALFLALSVVPANAKPHKRGKKKADAALVLHDTANKEYRAGKYKKAAKLYHSAFEISKRPAYLFNAARAEQRAFMHDAATRNFRRYLELNPKDERGVRRAKVHLKEMKEIKARIIKARSGGQATPGSSGGAAAPTPSASGDATTVASGGAPTWRAPVAWGLTGAGALVAGLGTWWVLSTREDSATLDDALAKKDGQGIVGITHEDAEAQRKSINGQLVRGYVGIGVGVAAAGAGVWMLMSRPKSTAWSVTPSSNGVHVGWQARF